jgi:uncharacterized membrane protein
MRRLVLAVVLLKAATAFVYRGILIAPNAELYPWASDTLGHVLKVEYLRQQTAQGILYPDLLPAWYLGVQMLRYYPPLPYYVLAGLTGVTGNAISAANGFIALCALMGSLFCLLYHRWAGWLPATAGGLLFLVLPDNVRVALAEGNLPRVLAAALLPLTLYLLLRAMEKDGTRRHWLGLSVCFALIVLCHAMMAAIYAACCALLAGLCWIARVTTLKRAALALACAALGLMLSGWWLLPSLTGGITELDSAAMTEALAVFPWTTYLNPLLRMSDPEIVYPGAVLLMTAIAILIARRERMSVVLALTGLAGVAITTPGFNAAFNALPMHNLLWPLRFVGIASFLLLLAAVWQAQAWKTKPLIPVVFAFLLVADGAVSLRLIHQRAARPEVRATADQLARLTGWREATLDYSRLGSAASYFFTAAGHREQLFGWAYQGARTARNVAAINEAVQQGHIPYALDRLALMGADDVVVLNDGVRGSNLLAALTAAGFAPQFTGQEITLYHRDGAPRAIRAHWRVLGIGRGAQNLAYLFPQIILGTRTQVDDYTPEEMMAYDTIVLSGFQWANRQRAETIVRQVAEAGKRVVIDLTHSPNDPLAQEPHFMDVWGETIILGPGPVAVQGEGRAYTLQSFTGQDSSWVAHTPQGLQVEVLHHNYLGTQSTVLGYNRYGAGRVWFVGLNLPYHAALTRDPAAIELLADVLQLPPDQPNNYSALPLEDYAPSQAGYAFTYTLDASDVLLVPVAHHEGMQAQVDGKPVRLRSLENMVAFDAPAGQHHVVIQVRPTPIYTLGKFISLLGILGLVALSTPFVIRWAATS